MAKTSEIIQKLRKDNGLTQAQLGEKIGYSRSYVKDVESGRTEASRRFLVNMSEAFNISINSLLNVDPILKLIDQNRGHENPGIPFLMGFTQDEIDKIESYLKEILADKEVLFVDGALCNSVIQLLTAMTGEKGNRWVLFQKLEKRLLNPNSEIMLVVKNLSQSKMKNKNKAGHLRDVFKILDDAWVPDEDRKNLVHLKPKSCLIVIDFPSFLESSYSDIGHYAIPIYPEFLKL